MVKLLDLKDQPLVDKVADTISKAKFETLGKKVLHV